MSTHSGRHCNYLFKMNNILDSTYTKALNQNEINLKFYEDYKKDHEELITNLNTLKEQYEPSILVPICSRILMKGNLIHTNEIMVSIGSEYFMKCNVSKAQKVCERRITKANNIIIELEREKDYLENQVKFKQENIFSPNQKEIIEDYDEENEKKWRIEHARRLKEHRIQENEQMRSLDHKQVMDRLEMLELQEDIDALLAQGGAKGNHFLTPPLDKIVHPSQGDKLEVQNPSVETTTPTQEETKMVEDNVNIDECKEFVLRKKLATLRQKKKSKCLTEEDVLKRLDELEEEEEIEDQLDRLYDDMYGTTQPDQSDSEEERDQSEGEEQTIQPQPSARRVSFSKTDVEIQTLNIYFKHSNGDGASSVPSSDTIESPSDIYKMFPKSFQTPQLKGIIKNCHKVAEEIHDKTNEEDDRKMMENPELDAATTAVSVGQVFEKHDEVEFKAESETQRPVSKFKAMRMANKKSK